MQMGLTCRLVREEIVRPGLCREETTLQGAWEHALREEIANVGPWRWGRPRAFATSRPCPSLAAGLACWTSLMGLGLDLDLGLRNGPKLGLK